MTASKYTDKITNKSLGVNHTNLFYNKIVPNEPIRINPSAISLVTPELIYDGLWIRISPNNSGELIFYKNLTDNLATDPRHYEGETIARIHFDNLEELRSIRGQIDETINMHEAREP